MITEEKIQEIIEYLDYYTSIGGHDCDNEALNLVNDLKRLDKYIVISEENDGYILTVKGFNSNIEIIGVLDFVKSSRLADALGVIRRGNQS